MWDQYNVFFQNEEIDKVLYMGYESSMDDRIQTYLEQAKSKIR